MKQCMFLSTLAVAALFFSLDAAELISNADFSEFVEYRPVPGKKSWKFKENKMPKSWQFNPNTPGQAEVLERPGGRKALRVTGNPAFFSHQFAARTRKEALSVEFKCNLKGTGSVRFRFFNNKGMSVNHTVALKEEDTPFMIRVDYPENCVKAFMISVNGMLELSTLAPAAVVPEAKAPPAAPGEREK